MFYHKQNVNMTDDEKNRCVLDFLEHIERHKNFVKSSFERRFVEGRMVQRSRVQADQTRQPPLPITVTFNPYPQRLLPPVRVSRRRQRRSPQDSLPDEVEFEAEVEDELSFDQMSNEYPELLDCLSTDGFDQRRFEHFARDLRQFSDRTDMNPKDVENEKTRIVSTLARTST